MTREIKFRGKNKKTGEWFYGNLYDKDISGRTHICTTKKGCLDIDPDTVGQYTGLKDKNGKEIYEGDILAGESLIDGTYNCGYVKYGNFNCSCCDGVYGWYLTDGDIRMLEEPYSCLFVIGNIHDDKELLNKIYDYE